MLEWFKRAEVDSGNRAGVTTDERGRVKALEREVKELRRANEILKLASAFFAQLSNPALRSCRTNRVDELLPEIKRVWKVNFCVYGARKVWHELRRQGLLVARCTVERLMACHGIQGLRRGKVIKTTVPANKALWSQDLVNRQFNADRPNRLWVADFTYCSTWQGWVYVAFVIDVFACRIVGWRMSSSMKPDFVLNALEQALYSRQPTDTDGLVHHSDRGSQYLSIRYTDLLIDVGIKASVGSTGDSYDNALAETINGLYKTELIHHRGPWKTKAALEMATLEWVAWFNNQRLMGSIGYIPPVEVEQNYYKQQANGIFEY